MNLEQLLNLLPYTIGGYALRITRYYDSDENAEMWEVAYIGDKDKCMCSTTAQSLEVAAYQTTTKLINNGFRSKNSAVCTNDKGCIACVDGNFKEITKSKFRIDDWIVQENIGTYKVIEVCDFWYEVIDTQNNHYSIGFDKEYMCHLWTIKDAKDGDVLAEDSCIFIIQKMDDNNTAAKTYCVLYDDGDFTDGSILYFDIDSTKPATKEQRELLFSKMKEAGYEWDSVKKELNEIEA